MPALDNNYRSPPVAYNDLSKILAFRNSSDVKNRILRPLSISGSSAHAAFLFGERPESMTCINTLYK